MTGVTRSTGKLRDVSAPLSRFNQGRTVCRTRHANVSPTNTYYIKSATDDTTDDTRVAMAWLKSLVIGNEQPKPFESGNSSGKRPDCRNPVNAPVYCRFESGGGGSTRTNDLRIMSSPQEYHIM